MTSITTTVESPSRAATVIDRMPSDEYHRQPGISNSMLSVFLAGPEVYHARYVARTATQKESTPAMQLGTLFHDAVLLGIEHAAVDIPAEALSKDGHRRGAGWEYFKAQYAGLDKVFLKPDEYAALKNMVDAVWSHPLASKLLDRADAAIEQSIFWTDERTGLRLRSRLDHRSLVRPLITDLKTTADVSRSCFAASLHKFGYARQAPFYKAAAAALTGEVHDFVFVAVEKTPPHRVRCFELDPREDRALQRGYEEMRAGLDALAECYQTNQWNDPHWDKILTLDLPGWAYTNQWEYDDGDSATT